MLMGKLKDLTGQRFGRLVVIERAENYVQPSGQKKTQWRCKCDCGNEIITVGYNLTRGLCTSCGCVRIERLVQMNKTHGKSNHILFSKWEHMKDRCYNPKDKRYKNYGGRGIKICNEWLNSFESFYEWSLENGYKDGLTIDRIDVNGNYEPNNCRWTTWDVQCNNRTNNVYIEYNGEINTLKQWCDILNIDYKKAHNRIHKLKWDVKRAFEEV